MRRGKMKLTHVPMVHRQMPEKVHLVLVEELLGQVELLQRRATIDARHGSEEDVGCVGHPPDIA
jgi:hypothetical protein